MKIERIAEGKEPLRCEVVVIGGGPVGITLGTDLARAGIDVIILESGIEDETQEHAALNQVENVGELSHPRQIAKRSHFHGLYSKTWSQVTQPFGVRCRALGGSTHAWSGKSAPFDPIDFSARPWVQHSGWPMSREDLDPYILRAMEELNLCPDEPDARFRDEHLQSFFWQFARSRIDSADVMRFGAELLGKSVAGLRIFLDATVSQIFLDKPGQRFSHLEVRSYDGKLRHVEADVCILAASGIENPRLLLASRAGDPSGIGNAHDLVGRHLMDHLGAQIGTIPAESMAQVNRRFGFSSVRHKGREHMFMHGLAITPETQQTDCLLNAAVYFTPIRSPDDPLDALRRLLKLKSKNAFRDLGSLVTGAGWLVRGIGTKVLLHDRFPKPLKDLVINMAIRVNPDLVADEFLSQGVPHKMVGLAIDAIIEQEPNPDSRISLSRESDRFGVPMARIDWQFNDREQRTFRRLAELVQEAFSKMAITDIRLESWVLAGDAGCPVIIDMGHTLGATRMAADPRFGVVDADCKVHGVEGLYVAGGSVFPTSGHANPTLMMLALAIRLADHLKSRLGKA